MGPLPRSCRPHSLPGQSRACERVRAVLPQHIRLKCADEGTVGTHTPLVRLRPTFLTFLALLTDLLPALRATAAGMMLLTTVLSSRLFFNPLHPPLLKRNGQGSRKPKTISFLRQDHQAAYARSGERRGGSRTPCSSSWQRSSSCRHRASRGCAISSTRAACQRIRTGTARSSPSQVHDLQTRSDTAICTDSRASC